MSSEAFVTLATNDGYALGALVLAQSIRQVGTKRNLVVLISNHLSDLIRKSLERNFDEVIVVDQLNSNDIEHLDLLSRPELGITFTKINCWLLEQYSKCVFLDADCLVLRSIDDLFQREEFSAAPDAGWPDCFNSGVFVYQPSKDTFHKLMLFASQQNASFDGGDQGLLNAFFSNWRTEDISRHLPFTYNVTANAFYSYLPAVTRFRNDIHIVHFAGALKPWQLTFNPQNEQLSGNLGGQNDIQRDFLLSWWRVMHEHVWPNINQLNQQSNANNKNSGGEDQLGNSLIDSLNYANLTDNKGIEVGSAAHRRAWEAGQIDYYGRDSFDKIQQQLERNIQQKSYEYQPSQPRQPSPDNTTTTTTTTTGILKSSVKEVTPATQQTTIRSQDVSKQPTTIISQSVINLPTTTTTNVSQHLSKESTNTLKSSLKGTTPLPQQQQPTTITSQHVTKLPTTAHVPKQSTNPLKSSFKEPTQSSEESPTNVSQSILKESIPLSTNPYKSSLKETTLETTFYSQRENPQTSTDSIRSNENKTPPLTEHESSWTVKSTIVTAYTQGSGELAGPIVVTKVVSETSATSSSDSAINTSVKKIADPTKSSGLNLTGNGTSVRGVTPSTNNGNRVNK